MKLLQYLIQKDLKFINMIPKHCIKKFKTKFNSYPCFISVNKEYVKTDIEKFFSKSYLVWFNERVNAEGQKTTTERFFEYDSTGIMVYIKEDGDIFILTTTDRQGVVYYMISNLKK